MYGLCATEERLVVGNRSSQLACRFIKETRCVINKAMVLGFRVSGFGVVGLGGIRGGCWELKVSFEVPSRL